MKGIDLHDIQQMLGYDIAKPYIDQARSARVLYNVIKDFSKDNMQKGIITLDNWNNAFKKLDSKQR